MAETSAALHNNHHYPEETMTMRMMANNFNDNADLLVRTDEVGFYEDADGLMYFLDRYGKEWYPTDEDIPDTFGFFQDDDGGVVFMDQDGVEHLCPIMADGSSRELLAPPPAAAAAAQEQQPEEKKTRGEDLWRSGTPRGVDKRMKKPQRSVSPVRRRTSSRDRSKSRDRSLESRSRHEGGRRARSLTRRDSSRRQLSVSPSRSRSPQPYEGYESFYNDSGHCLAEEEPPSQPTQQRGRGRGRSRGSVMDKLTASERGMTESTRDTPAELEFLEFVLAAEEEATKRASQQQLPTSKKNKVANFLTSGVTKAVKQTSKLGVGVVGAAADATLKAGKLAVDTTVAGGNAIAKGAASAVETATTMTLAQAAKANMLQQQQHQQSSSSRRHTSSSSSSSSPRRGR